MRTEVKIGIVIGLFVVGGVIILVLSQGGGATEDAAEFPFSNKNDLETVANRQEFSSPQPRERERPTRRTAEPERRGTDRPVTPDRTAAEERSSRQPTRRVERRSPVRPPATQPLGLGLPLVPDEERADGPSPVTPVAERPTPTTQPAKPSPTTRPAEQPQPKPRGRPGVTPPTGPEREEPNATPTPRLPRPERPQPAGAVKHTVAEGDSLWYLAQQYYDDPTLWPRIQAANNLKSDQLKLGQTLVIPPKDAVARQAPLPRREEPEAGRPGTRPRIYRVEQGDSLIKIARNILKDGSRWREIYELNKDLIENPDVLTVGTELRVPKD